MKQREPEVPPEVLIQQRREEIEGEEEKHTEEGDEAREFVKNLPESKRKEALLSFTYKFLPEFFQEHPKVLRRADPKEVPREQRPRHYIVNQDWRNALESHAKHFGHSLTNEDINYALDLANEWLDAHEKAMKEEGEAEVTSPDIAA